MLKEASRPLVLPLHLTGLLFPASIHLKILILPFRHVLLHTTYKVTSIMLVMRKWYMKHEPLHHLLSLTTNM